MGHNIRKYSSYLAVVMLLMTAGQARAGDVAERLSAGLHASSSTAATTTRARPKSMLRRMGAALHLNEARFAAGVGISAGIPGVANIEPWGGFIASGKDTGDKKRFRGLGAITGNLVLGLYGTYVHKPNELRGSAFGGTLGPFSLTTQHPLFKSRMLYFTLPHIMSIAAGDDVIGGTIALPIPFLPPVLRQTYCMFIQHPWLRPVNKYFMGPINRGIEHMKIKLSPVVIKAKEKLSPITKPIMAAGRRFKKGVAKRWKRSRLARLAKTRRVRAQ